MRFRVTVFIISAMLIGGTSSAWAQQLPEAGGWLGQGGGSLLRSGRFPDRCASLSWRVAKSVPLTLVEGLPDPIYLELCNCRIDAENNTAVLLTFKTSRAGNESKRRLGIGQCMFVAAVDLKMEAEDIEGFGTHEVVANPRQTITVINGGSGNAAAAQD